MFSVGAYECTDDQAPRFQVEQPSSCAPVDATGAGVDPDSLARVRIGWQVGERFHTQVR